MDLASLIASEEEWLEQGGVTPLPSPARGKVWHTCTWTCLEWHGVAWLDMGVLCCLDTCTFTCTCICTYTCNFPCT